MTLAEFETEARAYESVIVADSAVGFTAATLARATAAFVTLETAQVRFRYDGTNPTSSEGHLMDIGDSIRIKGPNNIKNFKAIRTGSTSGVLKVTFEE